MISWCCSPPLLWSGFSLVALPSLDSVLSICSSLWVFTLEWSFSWLVLRVHESHIAPGPDCSSSFRSYHFSDIEICKTSPTFSCCPQIGLLNFPASNFSYLGILSGLSDATLFLSASFFIFQNIYFKKELM